ncbi:MAG: hypothetical protein D6675_01205 [Gemmatimonadetes bacterium]|nr:MAG: hypothetical protein D6675_01205 [Gemmatimonadota bacterium]
MRKFYVSVFFSVLILLSGYVSAVNALTTASIMPVEQLKPGMIATGKSVFYGAEIDTFEVEILGVLRNSFYPQKDVIVARAIGDFLEHNGIMGGMSGSPIYIDGKLVGALAYGWGFMKDPIFGITPASDLIEVIEKPDLAVDEPSPLLPSFEDIAQKSFQASQVLPEFPVSAVDAQHFPALAGLEGQTMRPLQAPLIAEGFSPQAMALFQEVFQHTSFIPMQGSGGSSRYYDTSGIDLEAGSAVGVQFVRGDFNLSATGTVTFRDGDRIAGFGHPMFLTGNCLFPLTNAYLITPMPNLMSSWKMAIAGDVVGTMTQDRQTGIAGNIGEIPEMLPLDIQITNDQTDFHRAYSCEIVRSKALTPLFLFFTVMSAVETSLSNGKYMADMKVTVAMEGYADIVIEDTFAGETGLGFSAGMSAAMPINTLLTNTFEPVNVEQVTVAVNYRPEPQQAEITGIRVNRNRVRPGSSVEITAFLRPYRGDEFMETFEMAIPADMEDGVLVVTACDAQSGQEIELQRAPMRLQPHNLEQLIELIQMKDQSNAVIFEVFRLELGATVRGQELPAIPPSMIAVLSGTRQTGEGGVNLATRVAKQVRPTSYRVQGCQFLQIQVDSRAK